MKNHILIAGVGNIFLGDDAFGVEVARAMAARRSPNKLWCGISEFVVSTLPTLCWTTGAP